MRGRMPRLARTSLRAGLLAGLLAGPLAAPAASGADEKGVPGIAWHRRLADAFAAAQKEDKPILIAINSERVDGGRVEPAAKELRENTYKDPKVVEKSKQFVCAYLTSEGSSDDFGELRLRYEIDGLIVSPQHIFAFPDGSKIARHEYWPYGRGDAAVAALLDLMDKALAKDRARRGLAALPGGSSPPPSVAPEAPGAPAPGADPGAGDPAQPDSATADPEARARWIADVIALVCGGDPVLRQEALKKLLDADQGGDCVRAVAGAIETLKKDAQALVDVARALGRPGLEAAVEPLADLLDHKDLDVRANAAVSLEYVGSGTATDDLLKAAPREKDEGVANHLYRALGRCGAGQDKVRELLLKKVQGSKTDFAALGPIVGLSYFEKDVKTAREVEKLLLKEGVGGRGGAWGTGLLKRAYLTWTLSEVGDAKSAEFIRKKLIQELANVQNGWIRAAIEFYEAAAKKCEGDAEAAARVEEGVRRAMTGGNPLMDDARRGRTETGFEPKGDFTGTGNRPGAAPEKPETEEPPAPADGAPPAAPPAGGPTPPPADGAPTAPPAPER